MSSEKNYISLKILVSYIILATLFISVGWFLYSQSQSFSETESTISKESTTILKVSNLLSHIYKAENLARVTIQSNTRKDLHNYISKTNAIYKEIDSLKLFLKSSEQLNLLNSVQFLLSKKTKNIQQLKAIKNQTDDEQAVKNALRDLSRMQYSLRKLELEDFVKNPAILGRYQRNVLKKYVDYMNQNIPDDSTNTLTNKESDSILKASKMVLNDVLRGAEKKKKSLAIQENKLLQNELSISEQLGKVLNAIEKQVVQNTTISYLEREKTLKKTNQIVTIAAITGLLSSLLFLILILNDVSKTQSYKKQLETANAKTKLLLKNREQLISTVSHDLKTPLSTIIGYTELLDQSHLNTKQQHFTKNIKNASEYVAKLVRELLDFTQIESGKITLEKIPFSLNEVIIEVSKSIQSIYENKPISLSINVDKKLKNRIMGDPFRLRQILTNIIGNAYKFTAKGTIKIEANSNEDNSSLFITIADSGIGIEQQKQELIFEEFTQADKNIEKIYGGTGLGLTISKSMVGILGGKLTLKSELGKGSIFTIELPLEFDTSIPQKRFPTNDVQNKRTAIIIDDDFNLLNLTSQVLKQNNYTVLAFESSNEAINAVNTKAFDIVITDIQMPEMDGFSFLEKLISNPEIDYQNQPVIAITGRTDLDFAVYKKAGFTAVLQKPFRPQELLSVLDSVLNNTEKNSHSEKIAELNEVHSFYNLEGLKAFLNEDKEGLPSILIPFINTTQENITALENALSKKNKLEIKRIAHRMNPMFKQIQAHTITQKIDRLESQDLTFKTISKILGTLKIKTAEIIALLEKEIS